LGPRPNNGINPTQPTEFLRLVEQERPEVQRAELIARESNIRALAFYEKLGFRVEGRLKKRISLAGR
jgi:ribosomal protein S18 acetylase RimI-like enzyme